MLFSLYLPSVLRDLLIHARFFVAKNVSVSVVGVFFRALRAHFVSPRII